MPKKNKQVKRTDLILMLVVAASIVAALVIPFINRSIKHRRELAAMPKSIMPYIDGVAATQQVQSFYEQYSKPSRIQGAKANILKVYGSPNLVFYNEYYRHGFDPITCSTLVPNGVTSTLVSTGAEAVIDAAAFYPDNTKQIIRVHVVLGDEGMKIDSVKCPGDKGNLAPLQ